MNSTFAVAACVVALFRFVNWLLGQFMPEWEYGAVFVCAYAYFEWRAFKLEWQEFNDSSSRKD